MPTTSTVIVENGNNQIWSRDSVIIDLAMVIKNDQNILVHLNNEGPCAKNLGLYKLLDDLCAKFNYDPSRISIITCNQIEKHPIYKILHNAPMKHVHKLKQQLIKTPTEYKVFTKSSKHFGHFIGHGNQHRLHIGSVLHTQYIDKIIQTYHCNVKEPYHREFIQLENLMFGNYDQYTVDSAYKFLQTTPIKFKLDVVDTYPIRDYKMYGINSAYPFIFVDIVSQTYYSGNTFYLDEKMWRPIMNKTPFIVQGSQNFIYNLKKLGFQTFDQWWSEGYSEDPADHQPWEILSIIENLSKLTITELSEMYNEMKPVLDHNYELFLKLDPLKFKVFK